MKKKSSMEEIILKYALQNALRYGKAQPDKIISKVIGKKPELKKQAINLNEEIVKTVKKINNLRKEEIEKQLKMIAPELLKAKRTKKLGLKPLKIKKDISVVMRFEPSPTGPLHIGHSYVLSLNSEYCKKYKGKLILRISDTNPGNIDPDAYEMIKEDAIWLTNNNISEILIQSNRMELYYDYAEKLIETGDLYICTCPQGTFKALVDNKQACPCRSNDIEENKMRWKKMFTEYQPGNAAARFKTDIKHKNPAMRDFPCFRITDEEHPKHGKHYRVWPLMNFAVAVDDADSSVTHIVRAKDHADNAKKQEYIHKALKQNIPETIFLGMINFQLKRLSTSEIRKEIIKGKYIGWDDIRLPFLRALKRRGYQPGALLRYALEIGVTQTDKTISAEDFYKSLNAFNKEIIEPIAHRYYFVDHPVRIIINGAPEQEFQLDLHPDYKKGGRFFRTKEEFYITKDDFDAIKTGEEVRLKGCLNFKKESEGKFKYVEGDHTTFKGRKIIHWLTRDWVDIEVLMPDASVRKGKGERWLRKLKEGTLVQFERFGFCRLDSIKTDKLVFWFTHR